MDQSWRFTSRSSQAASCLAMEEVVGDGIHSISAVEEDQDLIAFLLYLLILR
jgi:hypothetical protein